MSLASGEQEPARTDDRIPARGRIEVKLADLVLRFGVAKHARSVEDEPVGLLVILGDAGFGDTFLVVFAHLDEGVGDDVGFDALGRGLGVLVRDLFEIAERLGLVLRDALAVFVHQPELPQGHGIALRRGIFERRDLIGGRYAGAGRIECIGQRLRRINRRLGEGRRDAEGKARTQRKRAKSLRSRYPHTAPSRPLRRGWSVRHSAPAPPAGHISKWRPSRIRARAEPSQPCAG